jgi:hypothetical protein
VTKTLRANHAVDVGGRVVEPDQAIPDDADPDIVARLEADGLIEQTKAKGSGKGSSKSEG